MKARRFRTLLTTELGYREVRRKGSHRRLEAPDRPPLTLAFHDATEMAPNQIWKVLVRDAELSDTEAEEVLRRGRLH